MIGSVSDLQRQLAAQAAARKAVEAEPGPGRFTEPSAPPGPDAFSRPYLDSGHAAPSPLHQGPNVNPLPPEGTGILRPVELPAAPVVSGHPGPMMTTLAVHQAKAQMRPPVPPGRAQ
jgi:hypothetical protein